MLTSVIISVIAGTICLLLAIFNQKNASLRITMGIIGIVLLFYGGYGYGSLNLLPVIETYDTGNTVAVEYPITKVQVISPVEGDSVSCRILTMGVYPENHEKDIWVLLKPSDNKFYPQSDYTNTSYKENGKWQVVTRFGGDQGEAYDLYVYEADKAASQFFSETIAQWKEADDYEGLQQQELPAGIKEIDRKQVHLARNCRGIH
ncbi:DUF2892 domain-containing protein [Muriicola soli]|uniref:DUF2892 domain-containing protein n=1 Tax=Muriicola soli TaxID=2507538 RepID=A0A411E9D7_9FLAO|nr:DUF2892 domain-containing protein [Muriicola soli]QBA64144.1 DUF2892 domain-containing protein [Muriicola soli]